MQVIATHRYARISAFKAREVTREIQGLPAVDALQQLGFIPKKAAPLIAKTLKSAIANAEQKGINIDALFVSTVMVDQGPTMRRFMPRALGRAFRVNKKTSHVHLELDEKTTK